MFDRISGSLHLAQYSKEEWLEFTVQHRASTFTAAATLAPTIAVQDLKIYGSWLLETMSSVVGAAVGQLFPALQSLKSLHIYEFPAHVPHTLETALSSLTALTELILENPHCPLTHRNVNAVVSACSAMPALRNVELPYYLQESKGAAEVCDIVGTLQQIESLNMHGCFRNVESLGSYLGSRVEQDQAFLELPQVVASCLGKLSNLRNLQLTESFEGQDLEDVMLAIGGMQQLTRLSLAGTECCTKRLTAIFAGFHAFSIFRRSACGGLKPMLQQLAGLQDLDLSGQVLPSDILETATAIASMTKLTALCLSAVEALPEFWTTLAPKLTLNRLVRLDLSKVESIDATSMSRLAESMACMQHMEDLHLTGSHVGTAAAAVFKSLRSMPLLQRLGMGHCSISSRVQIGGTAFSDELSALSTLTNLQTLIVAFNDLGAAPRSPASIICCFGFLLDPRPAKLVQEGFHMMQVYLEPRPWPRVSVE